MKKLLLYLFVFTTSSIIAQKVAIVGLNHVSSPDGFTFVATENLSVGEVIYFTENEYNNSTNKFNDLNESVVKFTVTTAINKGNVVYVAETGITTDTLTITASSGAGTAVKTSSSSNFAIATSGESLYAYSDTDENPTNGVTEIYAAIYTGISSASGGDRGSSSGSSAKNVLGVFMRGLLCRRLCKE